MAVAKLSKNKITNKKGYFYPLIEFSVLNCKSNYNKKNTILQDIFTLEKLNDYNLGSIITDNYHSQRGQTYNR